MVPTGVFLENPMYPKNNFRKLIDIHKTKEKHQYSILMHILEKAMAPYSSTLAWKIPWTEEPGRLQSMGSQRVGHN